MIILTVLQILDNILLIPNMTRISFFLQSTLVAIPIPFVLLSFFNHPSRDDFCYANKVLEQGFWNSQINWYNNWTGRYFSTGILS